MNPRRKRLLLTLGLGSWLVLVVVGLGSLGVSHEAPMPGSVDEGAVAKAALALRADSSADFLVHIIYSGCSCTSRLFAHLMQRGPFAGARELILYVGDDSAKAHGAERAGFSYRAITVQELEKNFGLESAPIMIALDRAGQMRYIGGYFDKPAAVVALDETIHGKIIGGEKADPLPVFGCAVSQRLQKRVDPFGIVYRR